MARKRSGPTLVEVLVIIAVSAMLIVLLILTVNRMRQTLAQIPPTSGPRVLSPQVENGKRSAARPNTTNGLPVNVVSIPGEM